MKYGTILLLCAIIFVFSAPNLYVALSHDVSTNWMHSDSGGKLMGDNWSLHNLIYNSRYYGKYLFNTTFQPFVVTIFALVGVVAMFIKRRKEALFLSIWFGLLWVAYFCSWFQTLGGSAEVVLVKERYFLSFYPIIVIFFSFGVLTVFSRVPFRFKWAKNGLAVVLSAFIIFSFKPYYIDTPYVRGIDSRLMLETQIPELAERDLPSGCVIVALFPEVLSSTTNLNVVDIGDFLSNRSYQESILASGDCVLFFNDYCCKGDWPRLEERAKCERLREEFYLSSFKSYRYGGQEYSFFRVTGRK